MPMVTSSTSSKLSNAVSDNLKATERCVAVGPILFSSVILGPPPGLGNQITLFVYKSKIHVIAMATQGAPYFVEALFVLPVVNPT